MVAKEEVVKGRSYVSSAENHVGRGGGEAERSVVNNVCWKDCAFQHKL